MEELRITSKELNSIISKLGNDYLGRGWRSIVFLNNGKLIKLDSGLRYIFQHNSDLKEEEKIKEYLKVYGNDSFVDMKQMHFFDEKRKFLTRNKLPLGILIVDDIIPGLILPYHEGYKNLEKFPVGNKIELLNLFKRILLSLQELENNSMCQSDIVTELGTYNVMYKGEDVQLIDLDSRFLIYGEDYHGAEEMYQQFGEMVLDFCQKEDKTYTFNYMLVKTYYDACKLLEDVKGHVMVKK